MKTIHKVFRFIYSIPLLWLQWFTVATLVFSACNERRNASRIQELEARIDALENDDTPTVSTVYVGL